MTTEIAEEPVPAEPEPEPKTEPRMRADWKPRILDWLQFIRSALINGVIIAAIVAVLVFAAKDIYRQPVIIEKFALPSELTERGFSGAVTAHRVWDAMSVIQQEAGSFKQTQSLLAESRQLDVVEPGSGLSLRNLTMMLRSLTGIEQTRIAGEVVCDQEDCNWENLSLRLRIFTESRMHIVNTGPAGDREPDQLFRESALEALRIIDPYVFAAYLFAKDGIKNKTAIEVANQLVDTGHAQSAWAANLLGNHAQSEGRHEAAIEWFEVSIELAKEIGPRNFALPYYGKGNSLYAEKEYEDAVDAFERAIAVDRSYASPHYGKGQALMAMGDFRQAEKSFRKASELDRRDAAHWAGLGDAMKRLEDPEDAIEHLERAVRLNRDFAAARTALGQLLMERGRHEDAVPHLTRVTELQPDNATAWDDLAAAYEALGNEDLQQEAHNAASKVRTAQISEFFFGLGEMVSDL